MKIKIFALTYFLILLTGCSHTAPTEGEVTDVTGPQTLQAIYKGNDLKVGDRVLVLEKTDVSTDFGQGKNDVPFRDKRTAIGQGTVSNVLSNNFYELKMDKAQHVQEGNTVIQKL